MLEQETHSRKPMMPRRWAGNDKVTFAQSTVDSRESPFDADQARYTEDEVHLLGEADISITTDELPSTLVGSSTTIRTHYWLFKPMSQPHMLITKNGTEACHVTVLVGKRHTWRMHMAEDRHNRRPHPFVMSATSLVIYHHAASTALRTERKSSRFTSHSPKWSAHECQILHTSVRKQSFNQMGHPSRMDYRSRPNSMAHNPDPNAMNGIPLQWDSERQEQISPNFTPLVRETNQRSPK